MGCVKDAEMLAVQRAAAGLGVDEVMDFAERYYAGTATAAEVAAVHAEFAKVTRADIGRPPLPDRGQDDSFQSVDNHEPIL